MTINIEWLIRNMKFFFADPGGYVSLIFLLALACFLGVNCILRSNHIKKMWILVGSLTFYLWNGGLAALAIICATALTVYVVSMCMDQIYAKFDEKKQGLSPKEQATLFTQYKKRAKLYLWIGIGLVLTVWVYVKVAKLLKMDVSTSFQGFSLFQNVIVPLGISYYSLSAIGYLLDVYWRKTKPERNLLSLVTVMTYFPYIIQGPISKYQKILSQLNSLPSFSYERVCFGLQLMLWGYIKKMVIADRLSMFTNTIFAAPEKFAGVEIIVAILLCVFQLYADFSGCMDIVCGISQAIGIELAANFKQPLFSKSAAEFWRRWHITLGAWMKDYIFLPISTNPRFIKFTFEIKKSGKVRLSAFWKQFIPSVCVWLLTGLWHGTGMDYVVWGMYWCTLIVLSAHFKPETDRLCKKFHLNTDARGYHFWQAVRTTLLFAIGRTFTIAGGLPGFVVIWKSLFTELRLWVLFDGSLKTHGLDSIDFRIALLGILVMLLVDWWHEKGIHIRERISTLALPLRWGVYYAAILAVVFLGIYGRGYDAASFVYGAF